MKQLSTLIFLMSLTACYSSNPQKTGKEGKIMPNFEILLTDSTTKINTNNIPAGTPSVLLYFSPYCPYCKAQIKEIIEDIDKLKKINFFLISTFPATTLKAFTKNLGIDKYPNNIIVGMDLTHSIGDYFEIVGVPYMAIYGKDKKLIKTFLGGKLYSSQIIKIIEE